MSKELLEMEFEDLGIKFNILTAKLNSDRGASLNTKRERLQQINAISDRRKELIQEMSTQTTNQQ